MQTGSQIRSALGFAWLANGNREAAVNALTDSVARQAFPSAYFGLARIYADCGQVSEARAAVASAFVMQPENVDFQRLSAKLGTAP